MDEGSQVRIPEAFVALFVPAGRSRPTASQAFITERHEFCEDLAQALTETARARWFELSITEQDVLVRIGAALRAEGSGLTQPEAGWVLGRLAELLGWEQPEHEPLSRDSSG